MKCCQIEQGWTKGSRHGENLNGTISLSGILKRQSLKDVTFHTISHLKHTAAHALFMTAVSE